MTEMSAGRVIPEVEKNKPCNPISDLRERHVTPPRIPAYVLNNERETQLVEQYQKQCKMKPCQLISDLREIADTPPRILAHD